MVSWDVVDCEYNMNVIRSTWAFKLNRYPDGLIKKFKSRFCALGGMQLEGIYIHLVLMRMLLNITSFF